MRWSAASRWFACLLSRKRRTASATTCLRPSRSATIALIRHSLSLNESHKAATGGRGRSMDKELIDELVQSALDAQQRAYCPFSNFPVGAALLTSSGRIYQGVNVENASFGLTICAERVAAGAAVADGERDFTAI